jgi:hypothetical protein
MTKFYRIILLLLLGLTSCINLDFARETHFDLYRNADGSYGFNYLQYRSLGQGMETMQNLKNWTSAYRQCQNYRIINKRTSMNYYIINGLCI